MSTQDTARFKMTTRRMRVAALALAYSLVLIGACSEQGTPIAPSSVITTPVADLSSHSTTMEHDNHNAAATHKGFIDGWFDGDEVSLYYTKSFFCAEPPLSGAESNCVVGAEPGVAPRPGPIPTIYALAAVGFQPDPATLACAPGSPCLNHPLMIDVSRVAGPGATNVPGLPHSHILDERRAGWFETVNIRVFNIGVWNEVVAAKSLAKVRELQANPAIGGAGLISPDTPTNIFFFIASWR